MFGRHFNSLYYFLKNQDSKEGQDFISQFLNYITNNQIANIIKDYELNQFIEDEFENIIYNFNEFIKKKFG